MLHLENDCEIFCYSIGELGFCLDLEGSGLYFVPPKCLLKFIQPAYTQAGIWSRKHNITIKVVDDDRFPIAPATKPVYSSLTWQFWRTSEDWLVFFAPGQRPPLQLSVHPDFSRGQVVGNFSAFPRENCYPLENLDIRLLSAWLASLGDIILHASGVIVDGRGYCFTGASGAGKSTLAVQLAQSVSATVLGEDQIVLRYQEGRFWMYGTPWHVHEEMCSPKKVPLEKLFFININDPEGVRGVSGLDGVTRLLQTAFVPYHLQEYLPRIMDQLVLLAGQVSFHSLSYKLDTDPWPMVRSA